MSIGKHLEESKQPFPWCYIHASMESWLGGNTYVGANEAHVAAWEALDEMFNTSRLMIASI